MQTVIQLGFMDHMAGISQVRRWASTLCRTQRGPASREGALFSPPPPLPPPLPSLHGLCSVP